MHFFHSTNTLLLYLLARHVRPPECYLGGQLVVSNRIVDVISEVTTKVQIIDAWTESFLGLWGQYDSNSFRHL